MPHQSTSLVRTCLHCGIDFRIRASLVAKGRGKYCSKTCKDAARTLSETVPCTYCGKPFRRKPSQTGRSDHLYCSWECFRAAPRRNAYVDRTCSYCGTTFRTHFSNVRRGYGETCSRECADARRRDESKRDRASWQYVQWRKGVLARDKETCQECGATNTTLHVHHIKAWATHPELRFEVANGLTLCVSCHSQKHPHWSRLPRRTTAG